MPRTSWGAVICSAVGLACLTGTPGAGQRLPPDSVVRAMLKERVDAGANAGIVVGLVDVGGRRIVAWGTSGRRGLPLDGRTLFEIGSISKVLTAAVLADAVARGEVGLDQPVKTLLPRGVSVPSRQGRQITLGDLASHTSGLPRLPTDLRAETEDDDTWASYDAPKLYAFLATYRLPRVPGKGYEYSSLGVALLGHALALKNGTSYEALVIRRILAPLGMNDTRIQLDAALAPRLAQTHLASGKSVARYEFGIFAPAGAFVSDADDMLKLIAANLAPPRSGLPAVFATMRRPRASAWPGMDVGLGWHIDMQSGHPVVWHNGGTFGSSSFIAYDTSTSTGVVVLSNTGQSIDDIGFHLLYDHH